MPFDREAVSEHALAGQVNIPHSQEKATSATENVSHGGKIPDDTTAQARVWQSDTQTACVGYTLSAAARAVLV